MKKPKHITYVNEVLSVFETIPEKYWAKVLYLVISIISEYVPDKKRDRYLIDGNIYHIKGKGKGKTDLGRISGIE